MKILARCSRVKEVGKLRKRVYLAGLLAVVDAVPAFL
jgi:hypothetical protein